MGTPRSRIDAVVVGAGVIGLTGGVELAERGLGVVLTLAAPGLPNVALSLLSHDETAPVSPDVSMHVDDVDACHSAAARAGAEIVHLTDERWGVRRFFVRDPGGHVINVLSHL